MSWITPHDYYSFEECHRLDPVEEERLRMALDHVEREAFLQAIDRDRIRIIDAWVTGSPPQGSSYLSSAVALRATFTAYYTRARARRRKHWWLPWRRGGRT